MAHVCQEGALGPIRGLGRVLGLPELGGSGALLLGQLAHRDHAGFEHLDRPGHFRDLVAPLADRDVGVHVPSGQPLHAFGHRADRARDAETDEPGREPAKGDRYGRNQHGQGDRMVDLRFSYGPERVLLCLDRELQSFNRVRDLRSDPVELVPDRVVAQDDDVVDIFKGPRVDPLIVPNVCRQLDSPGVLEVAHQLIEPLLHLDKLFEHAAIGRVVVLDQESTGIEPCQHHGAQGQTRPVRGLRVPISERAGHDPGQVRFHLRADDVEGAEHDLVTFGLHRSHLFEMGEVIVKLLIETLDDQQIAGVRRQRAGFGDHLNRLLRTRLDGIDIVSALRDHKVLRAETRHQHVRLDPPIRIRLPRESAVCLEVPVGANETDQVDHRNQ